MPASAHQAGGERVAAGGKAIVSPGSQRHRLAADQAETDGGNGGRDDAAGRTLQDLGKEDPGKIRLERKDQRGRSDHADAERDQTALPFDSIGERPAGDLAQHPGDRADRQRKPDVALRPPEMRQIEGDKSPEPGLYVGNEEVRPVEAAPAPHGSRRAQGLAGFAIAPGGGAQPRTRRIVGAAHRRSCGRSSSSRRANIRRKRRFASPRPAQCEDGDWRGERRRKGCGNERARTRKRTPAGLQARIPQRPRMNHARPNLQGDGDIGGAGGGSKTHRIVEQGLVGADLDQHRRESAQVRKERRHPRVLPVERCGEIRGGQFLKVRLVDERVRRRPCWPSLIRTSSGRSTARRATRKRAAPLRWRAGG